MEIHLPHSSPTVLRSTETGRRRLLRSVCSDTSPALLKTVLKINARAAVQTGNYLERLRKRSKRRDCAKDKKNGAAAYGLHRFKLGV